VSCYGWNGVMFYKFTTTTIKRLTLSGFSQTRRSITNSRPKLLSRSRFTNHSDCCCFAVPQFPLTRLSYGEHYGVTFCRRTVKRVGSSCKRNETHLLADRTATQYDRLLAAACCPSVCLSVCNAVHCGSQGWCTGLKVIPACS